MAKEIPAKRRAVSGFSREHMVEVAKDLALRNRIMRSITPIRQHHPRPSASMSAN